MTSIFGGQQSVPTTQTQFTNQAMNQASTQTQSGAGAQTYQTNPWADLLGKGLTDIAYNNIRAGYVQPNVPGLQVAPLTGEQQTGITGLTGAGYGAGNALVPAGQNALVNAGQGITSGDINQFLNPYQDYVTQNLQNIFGQQNLANRIGGTTATGGVGGDRAAVAQALLAKQQGLAAGQTYAGLYQSALQAAQQQKAQQLQAGQAALQGGLGAWGQGLQAASIPQAQQQAINQALYQQQLGTYQDPFLRVAALAGAIPTVAGLGGTGGTLSNQISTGALSGTQSGTGGGTSTTTYPAPPMMSQIAGLGSLALGAGALFSDKRDKTDIQKVGKDKGSGLPMYAYRYKGDPKTYPKVVGPMAQDVKKKYPSAVKEFARGGGIPHFQYGGGEESQQQDTNYLSGFSDYQPMAGSEGGDAPAAPYAEEQSAWDPKRIFSPDRLQKAQRAIAMAQRAAQQSQTARPRVAPITFPQTPWKMGWGSFQRGGRLAINLPALSRAIAAQQEGGRVDAATADSWGGHKVWRPGMRWNFESDYDEKGAPFAPDARDKAVGLRAPMRMVPPAPGRYPMLDMRRSPEGVYRLGGGVQSYQDGGFADPLAGMDPMPESEPEPPGLPEYEDMPDTGEDLPAIPVPQPRPPGAGQGIPFTPRGGGAAPAAGGQTMFGRPVSPGAMALIQAGLGMLAASGQRDARGLPMSGLAAIGKGGGAGLETYQSMQNQQQKDLLAQQGMRLREQTLAQNLTRQNADLALRQQAQADLERHRANLLAQRSGEDRPFTVKGPYGDRTVIKKADGTYEEIRPSKPQPGVIEPPEEKTGTAAFDPSGGPTPPVSDDEKDTAARVMTEGGFKSPLKVDSELLDAMQTSPEQFDFNAARLALGDTSVLQGYGNRQAAVAYRNALKSRAAQYWLDRGLTANDANAAVAEFGAMKAGARTLGQQEARITGALEKAASVAPVVKDLSKQVSRTNYPALNKIIVAAKEQTGDPTVIKYGIAIETLITEYGSALGQGNSVLTDHQSKRAENILKKAYSEGQMDAAVDQLLVEIDRVKAGVRKGMGTYLGKRESSPFAPVQPPASGQSQPAGKPAGTPTISSKDEYEKLPSGTEFIMNGKSYRKP